MPKSLLSSDLMLEHASCPGTPKPGFKLEAGVEVDRPLVCVGSWPRATPQREGLQMESS